MNRTVRTGVPWHGPRAEALTPAASSGRSLTSIAIGGWALIALLALIAELDASVRVGAVTLTPARLLLAVAGAAVTADLIGQRDLAILRRPLTVGLLLIVLAAVALVWSSAFTNGCNCRGSAAGLGEFGALALLAAYVLSRDEIWRDRFIYAAGAGVIIAAIVAIPDVASGQGGRVSGSYGNPNNLAFALALGVPILVSMMIDERRSRPRVVGLAAGALLVAGMVFLTFSRAGLLAMGAGIVALAVLTVSTRRARVAIGAVVLVLAGLGVLVYPAFEGSRLTADIGSARSRVVLTDHQMGWNSLATGLIRKGPAALTSLPGGRLRITAGTAGEGASLRLGVAARGVRQTVRLDAWSASDGIPVRLGLEDNKRGLGPSVRAVRLSTEKRRYTIAWTPLGTAEHARLYVWLGAAGEVQLTDVSRRIGESPAPFSKLTAGAISPAALSRAVAAKETRDLQFRHQVLSLAWRAFIDHPLRGIGWERFPSYVAARSQYGEQGAQSEYARYAAELGIGGVLLMVGFALIAILALARDFPHRPAVAGSLAVAAVGLAFDSALETVSISATVAVMLAIACTDHRRRCHVPRRRMRKRPVQSDRSQGWSPKRSARAMISGASTRER